MDQRQIEELLITEGKALSQLMRDYEETMRAMGVAEINYRREEAQSMLRLAGVKMTADLRKAQVALDTLGSFEAQKMCQIAHSVVKEKIGCTKSRLDVLRTLSASNRQVV